MELSRVEVLASRPVEGNIVSQLIDNQTLLLGNTPGWPGPFYKSSRQNSEAAYG
jgi:hypothetical protein